MLWTAGAQSWIRTNQLGYLPNTVKVAVYISQNPGAAPDFTVCDALTDVVVFKGKAALYDGAVWGMASAARLDFTGLTVPGGYYISYENTHSEIFRIDAGVYDGTADYILKYIRAQRCGYNPFLADSCHTHDGIIVDHPTLTGTPIDVRGGYHDASDHLRYTATTATSVYQMMFAYNRSPEVYGDMYDAAGTPGSNGIPDILDEVRWGLEWLIKMNPETEIHVYPVRLTSGNIADIIADYDVILDGTDNRETKYLINDVCVLHEIPLVYGSIYKYDGYMASFNVRLESGFTANLRDAFPEPPKNPVPSCAEVGTLNPVVGLIALLQTNEVIKIIAGIGEPVVNQLLVYNSLNNQQLKIKLQAGANRERIAGLFKKELYADSACEIQEMQLLIAAEVLKEHLTNEAFYLISVIEKAETPLPFQVHAKIPFSAFDPHKLAVDQSKKYVFLCNKGILSYAAAVRMKEVYPTLEVFSLEKGIQELNEEKI